MSNKKQYIITMAIIIITIILFSWKNFSSDEALMEMPVNRTEDGAESMMQKSPVVFEVPSGFNTPLDRAKERVSKKSFGIFITPQTSPVQPEKFHGYHTGTDFEIFPEELSAEVKIQAVCSGKLEMKKYATGYGGVAVESCILDNQPITVIYGHLRFSSIAVSPGADLKAGDTIGVLGDAYSVETSGERKHLHLGFHKGTSVNILGYVQNKAELSAWLDPCTYVCNN